MKLRCGTPQDLEAVLNLFVRSIREVACADYTGPQLDAWAASAENRDRWRAMLTGETGLRFFLAEQDGVLCGFGSFLRSEELLDHLYVSPDFQRRGAAALLSGQIEALAQRESCTALYTEASLTARGFFERRGYQVLQRQQVDRQGQLLTNFAMQKKFR